MHVVAWLYTAPDSTVWETATTIPCSDRKRKQKSFRKDSGWSLNCLWKLRKMPILSVSEGARFSRVKDAVIAHGLLFTRS